jgi:hypothetical protein
VTDTVFVVLGIAFVVVVVPLAYILGRMLWHEIEPDDDDPGGKESPPPQFDPKVWTGTPFVEMLRLSRRLRERQRPREPKNDS